jgi:hypothetical protein
LDWGVIAGSARKIDPICTLCGADGPVLDRCPPKWSAEGVGKHRFQIANRVLIQE